MFNLDHNATTSLLPEVAALLAEAVRDGTALGNPSSVHGLGRAARERVETARRQVAAGLGCDPLEVVFTSGGTEADNLAILGAARACAQAGRPSGILASRIEHPAVTEALRAAAAEGHPWVELPTDAYGRITAERIVECLRAHPEIGMVSIAAAHHELGNAIAIEACVSAIRAERPEVLVHTDAVQAVGKAVVDFRAWGVDLLAMSGHKLGAPAGIGALLVRRGLRLSPRLHGGGQERGVRPGTENVLGVLGLGCAVATCTTALPARTDRLRAIERRLRPALLAAGARIHGDVEHTIGNTLNVAFPGCEGELLAMNLDLEGIAVSTGSACASGSVEPSSVLRALGLSPAEAREAIRISWSPATPDEALERLLAILPVAVHRVREATRVEHVG